jgi:23S rRNA (uracil1939-C5)-methyltransferase
VELAVTQTARGPVCGFSQAGTHDVLPIDRCLLLPEHASRLPAAVAGALRFLATRGASGILRVTIRVSTSGEIACDLWTQGGPFPRNAVARTIAQATGARSVSRVIVRGAIERRDISNVEVLSGDGRWHESLGADRYVVSPASFFQVNTGAAMLLREMVVRCVAPDGVTRAADLYAGVGTFTLPMARLAGETVAVEASRYAISDLRRNLERNRLAAEIVPGDAARALPGLGGLDAVVLDPPRQGLAPEALTALAAAGVPRVVYVSCDPATLARDVRALSHAGYRAPRFWPVDLFPQTYHIETVALLERA